MRDDAHRSGAWKEQESGLAGLLVLFVGGASITFMSAAAHQDLWKRDLSPDAPAPYHTWLKQ
jgi:hypothetical protein